MTSTRRNAPVPSRTAASSPLELLVRPLAALALVVAPLAGACGGAERVPEAPSAPVASASTRSKPKPRLQLAGELGSLDQGKVDETFAKLLPELSSCLTEASARVEFIAGHVRFFVRIGVDGSTKWVYLPDSTMGDHETEGCMLDKVRAVHWPPPVDGEGQAEKSFDFDPSPDVREPVTWSADRIAKTLSKVQGKLAQCVEKSRRKFKVTAYVKTDGALLAAGVASPDERGDRATDCLVTILKGLKFPSPGSWPAKVTFEVP